MSNEVILKNLMKNIVEKIISGTIDEFEIREKVKSELESRDVWESDDFLITDCYYALKHIGEELISAYEWKYFFECFQGYRKYNLEEKMNFILSNDKRFAGHNNDISSDSI